MNHWWLSDFPVRLPLFGGRSPIFLTPYLPADCPRTPTGCEVKVGLTQVRYALSEGIENSEVRAVLLCTLERPGRDNAGENEWTTWQDQGDVEVDVTIAHRCGQAQLKSARRNNLRLADGKVPRGRKSRNRHASLALVFQASEWAGWILLRPAQGTGARDWRKGPVQGSRIGQANVELKANSV